MSKRKCHLQDLRNVGKATLEDLRALGVDSVDLLATCDPMELFHRLEALTKKRQDPCVWDVFAAIIHEARTGEASPWWEWTPQRKALQESGDFSHFL